MVVGGLASFGLAATSQVTITYAASLAGLGVAWLTTAGMALAAVLHRNFALHRQWMIRSYVVTMAFVTFRVVEAQSDEWGCDAPTTSHLPTALAWDAALPFEDK